MIVIANMLKITALALLFVPMVFVQAQYDIDIEMDGLDVDVFDTDVDVDMEGMDVNVSGDDVSVDMDGFDVDVNANGNTSVKTDAATVRTTSSGNTSVKTNSFGTGDVDIKMDGLSVQTTGGNVSVEMEDLLINLDEDARVLIQTDADLDVYTDVVVDTNPLISSVSIDGDDVNVSYETKGRIFGVIPTSFVSRVEVGSTGKVSVKRPWYSFLVFGRNDADVESDIKASVRGMSVSLSADEKAFSQAQIIDVVSDGLSSSVRIDGDNVDVRSGGDSVKIDGENVEVESDEYGTVKIDEDGNVDIRQ